MPVASVHPLGTAGPPIEIEVANHCAGSPGPGVELVLEEANGLQTLAPFTGPACLFGSLDAPRECPPCNPDPCGFGDPAFMAEPEPEPDLDPETQELARREAALEVRRDAATRAILQQLPRGPFARIRIRQPGPALIYTHTATDEMFCSPNGDPARQDLALHPLVLAGPSEIWLPLPSARSYAPHRIVGALLGADPQELVRLLERSPERADGRKFEIPELPEGLLHEWTTDDVARCCCDEC